MMYCKTEVTEHCIYVFIIKRIYTHASLLQVVLEKVTETREKHKERHSDHNVEGPANREFPKADVTRNTNELISLFENFNLNRYQKSVSSGFICDWQRIARPYINICILLGS